MAELVLVRSDHGDGGWSLHDPDATQDAQDCGDDILLTGTATWDDGDNTWDRPTVDDYRAARCVLAQRRAL